MPVLAQVTKPLKAIVLILTEAEVTDLKENPKKFEIDDQTIEFLGGTWKSVCAFYDGQDVPEAERERRIESALVARSLPIFITGALLKYARDAMSVCGERCPGEDFHLGLGIVEDDTAMALFCAKYTEEETVVRDMRPNTYGGMTSLN